MNTIWSFLSVIVVAWITQKLIFSREKNRQIRLKQLDYFINAVPLLSEFYSAALSNENSPEVLKNLQKEFIQLQATFSIIGNCDLMNKFDDFASYVMTRCVNSESCDEAEARSKLSAVTCAMCCIVHDENIDDEAFRKRQESYQILIKWLNGDR